jgi:hypothetical protein
MLRPRRTVAALIGLAAMSLVGTISVQAQEPKKEKDGPPNKLENVGDDDRGLLAESAGLFASLQLYNAYLNIGILADAAADGIYDSTAAYQLLGSVVHPLERVEKQLTRIAKLKLAKDDLDAVTRLTKIAGLLRQQGKELELYWDKGLAENGKRYEAARQAAWKELASLLNLEPKSEKLSPPRTTTPPKKP